MLYNTKEKSFQSNWLPMPIIALLIFNLKYDKEAAINFCKGIPCFKLTCPSMDGCKAGTEGNGGSMVAKLKLNVMGKYGCKAGTLWGKVWLQS